MNEVGMLQTFYSHVMYSTCLLQCVGGGCLMELCIQLSIIFVGKQIMNSVVEVFMP